MKKEKRGFKMDVSLNTLENVEEVKIKKAVPAVLALMILL